MALVLFAELAAGGVADNAAMPDDELLEFIGGWAPEELLWLEDMLREESESEPPPPAQEGARDD